jgi:hypothetical protein
MDFFADLLVMEVISFLTFLMTPDCHNPDKDQGNGRRKRVSRQKKPTILCQPILGIMGKIT